jgi:hypothetical protein
MRKFILLAALALLITIVCLVPSCSESENLLQTRSPVPNQAASARIQTTAIAPYQYEAKYLQSKFSLANRLCAYTIGLQQTKSPPLTRIGLPQEPHGHNFLSWDFLQIEINGIRQNVLTPKLVEEFREENRAGWLLRFNFNGVFLELRFYLLPDSPLLWCEGVLKPLDGVKVESAVVKINCYPGKMIGGHFLSEIYDRAVFTPERELPLVQEKKWVKEAIPLTPADKLLFFNDRKHLPPDGCGPCAIMLEWNGLVGAEVATAAKTYLATTRLFVDPGNGSFRLGIFTSKKAWDEQELVTYLSAQK